MNAQFLPTVAFDGTHILINGQTWTPDDLRLLLYSYDTLWEEREPLMQREARLCKFAAEVIEAIDHPTGDALARIVESTERFKAWLAREAVQS